MTIKRCVRTAMTGLAVAVMALAALVAPADAVDEPHRAGLLIVHSGDRVSQRCIEFSEEMIDGLSLLQRSGLDLNVDATGSAGVAVCRIDNEGCAFPDQPCFCECLGANCIYWSYWRLTAGGEWQYANIGAASSIVSDRDVEAWVWGAGNSAGSLLPVVSFDEICAPAAPTATPTMTATPPPIAMWYPSDTPEPGPTNTATASSTSTVAVATATLLPTATMPLPAPVAPPTPEQSPAVSRPAPASAAGPAVPLTPMPTMHRGAPVITTPTLFPAQAEEVPEEIAPTRTVMATGLPEITATFTPPAVAQVIMTVASHPSATPTFLLASAQRATSTPAPQRAAGEAPSRMPITGMILAGLGVGGAAFLFLMRRASH